jgi:hypothetical protein
MRDDHFDSTAGVHVETRFTIGVKYRFFNVVDAAFLCATGEEMLRTLENEIPPEVGEADQVGFSV